MKKGKQKQHVTKRQRKLLGDLVLAYLLEGKQDIHTGLDLPLSDAKGLKSCGFVLLRKRGRRYVVRLTKDGWPIGHAYLRARFPVWESDRRSEEG